MIHVTKSTLARLNWKPGNPVSTVDATSSGCTEFSVVAPDWTFCTHTRSTRMQPKEGLVAMMGQGLGCHDITVFRMLETDPV